MCLWTRLQGRAEQWAGDTSLHLHWRRTHRYTHCVARLQTAAIEQLFWCHVPIFSQKYQKTLPVLKSRYPARMQMAPQVSHWDSSSLIKYLTWPHSQSASSLIPSPYSASFQSASGLIPSSYLAVLHYQKHLYVGQNLAVVYCSILGLL